MMDSEKEDKFYERLKAELNDTTTWPSSYLYKFIIPTEADKIARIEGVFDNSGAVISKKESSNGKYTSVSIQLIMESADAVIDKYKEVGKVEGVISL